MDTEKNLFEIQFQMQSGTLPVLAPPPSIRGWRHVHDETLRSLVEERMDAPPTPSTGQSSIQADVHGMGRRLRRDLLLVAERVKPCYPSHFAICQLYATWYHHCLGVRLRRLADFGLDDRDCIFLLRWVNDHYPQSVPHLPQCQITIISERKNDSRIDL